MGFLMLENVVKNYQLGQTTVQALRGVSLTIQHGEFSVIWGASGSGKSTILNILATIDKVSDGRFLFNGQEIAHWHDREITRLREQKIGIIFQSFNLLPVLTALENVMLPAQLNHSRPSADLTERAMAILQSVGVVDVAHHLPDQLSGGQRQRVALARALINQPQLVIADEPTANLDSKNSRNIIDLFSKMNEEFKTTFVFSSHDPQLIESAKRQIKLQDGEIIADHQCPSTPAQTLVSA
jgi:putative ABC transport system ATP-binding protein